MSITNPYHGGNPNRYGFGTGAGGGGGGGAVDSVFGRTGAVVAASGDYGSDLVTNESLVPGATVTDALNEVAAAIPPVAPVDSVFGRTGAVVAASGDYDATKIDYSNATSGLLANEVQSAIDELAQNQSSLKSISSGAPIRGNWPATGGSSVAPFFAPQFIKTGNIPATTILEIDTDSWTYNLGGAVTSSGRKLVSLIMNTGVTSTPQAGGMIVRVGYVNVPSASQIAPGVGTTLATVDMLIAPAAQAALYYRQDRYDFATPVSIPQGVMIFIEVNPVFWSLADCYITAIIE